jgi:tight adherence protein C
MTVSTIILVLGVSAVFVALFAGLVAVGGLSNEARGVSKSLAVVEAFSAAPKPMQDELDKSFKDRVLHPLADRFVDLGRRITPSDYADRVRRKLDEAGNPPGWTVDRVTAFKALGLGGMLTISLLYGLMLGLGTAKLLVLVALCSLAGYYGPNIYLYNNATKRTDRIRKTFPDAIDMLTISVEAGLGFDAALSQVSKNTHGPVAEEFSRVLQEMQIGLGRSEALRALGERSTLQEMRGFASAMVQADAFGIPIGQVLRVQSSEIRVKRRQRAEEKAQQLPVKILFPLMFCILPCLFIVIMGPAAITMRDLF